MILESHPVLHTICVLAFYSIGQACNVLSGAYIASKSSLNNVASIRHYFTQRWVPVSIRFFLCTCMFFIVWGNPSVLDLERFLPNFGAHVGVAGLLGWASDSVFDKVLGMFLPGIQKALPPIPDQINNGGQK